MIISFTGAVHGYLDVCGCAKFPLGSIARRASQMSSFQRRWPSAATFAVDAGNFSDLPGPAGAVKTRALVEAMNELGYRAAGVGARDLAFGPSALAELGSVARFPFLSANLVRAAQGKGWLPASHIVSAGGVRVGIVAAMHHDPLSSWALPDGTSLVTVDPVPAVARALRDLAGKVDVVVLLASMPLEDARLVAQRVPGIDLVIGGYAGHATLEVARYQLGEDVGADARWEAFTVEAMARAQEADDAARRPAMPASEARFAGVGGCSGCHLSIVEQWSKSAHAAAWKTLVRSGKKAQANCVPCHVTGHGEPGGFVDEQATPHLVGVGCEACHGPAAAHLADPARPYGKTGLASCTSCHTAEMDPTFNYYRDRQLVMHGVSSP